jgi:hypothetical protein
MGIAKRRVAPTGEFSRGSAKITPAAPVLLTPISSLTPFVGWHRHPEPARGPVPTISARGCTSAVLVGGANPVTMT